MMMMLKNDDDDDDAQSAKPEGLEISGDRSVSCRRLRLHVVVSGEQITMRSTWVSKSPPQTKVTLKQLFDPPSRGACRGSDPSAAGGWDPRWRCQSRAYVVVSGELTNHNAKHLGVQSGGRK